MIPNNLPPDMRDLLIRLDQKVADGFDAMTKKFDGFERRTDGLEVRVRDNENRIAKIETTAATTAKTLVAVWGAIVVIAVPVALKLLGLA